MESCGLRGVCEAAGRSVVIFLEDVMPPSKTLFARNTLYTNDWT